MRSPWWGFDGLTVLEQTRFRLTPELVGSVWACLLTDVVVRAPVAYARVLRRQWLCGVPDGKCTAGSIKDVLAPPRCVSRLCS